MQLTRYTDYGLRILIYLALLPQQQRANIDQISQVYTISRNNINKIVHQLGKAGVIKTHRGKGGGLQLSKKPEQINIGEMVLLLENSMDVVNCHTPQCKLLRGCKLKGILHQATDAFISTLKSYHLSDLIISDADANPLSQLLEISPA